MKADPRPAVLTPANPHQTRTYEEVARRLGLSVSSVHRIEQDALRKMRAAWVRKYGTEAA